MNNEADVQRGAEALELLKNRDTGDVPAGLFDKVLQAGAQAPQRIVTDRRFWQGAGFGGRIDRTISSGKSSAEGTGPDEGDTVGARLEIDSQVAAVLETTANRPQRASGNRRPCHCRIFVAKECS